MTNSKAEIVREYGPFEGVEGVHGVTFDGEQVWFCSGGDKINAFDPESGKTGAPRYRRQMPAPPSMANICTRSARARSTR